MGIRQKSRITLRAEKLMLIDTFRFIDAYTLVRSLNCFMLWFRL